MRVDSAPAMERTGLVAVKAELLSYGVLPTAAFLESYGEPYLRKRRAYGNSDPHEFREVLLPQELYLLPDRLVCAVTVRPESAWLLDFGSDGFVVRNESLGVEHPVDFPHTPAFYDRRMSTGDAVKNVVTLYGGGSLGIFVYGRCRLDDIGKACGYCSIGPNRQRGVDFVDVVSQRRLIESLQIALADDDCPVTQVMVNGGNFPDQDKSFSFYASLAVAAKGVVDESGRDVEVHLIAYPPRDLGRLADLRGTGVGLAMNHEVFDPALFEVFCPGKVVYGGQSHIVAALHRAVEELGVGNVYSIFVGGLEPVESLEQGLRSLGEGGVTPIVNVFHADPDTALENHPMPSPEMILEMGSALQRVYREFEVANPFYMNCGRNSLDTEAWLGLFE